MNDETRVTGDWRLDDDVTDDDDEVTQNNDDWTQYSNITSQFPVYVIEVLMVIDYAIYRRFTIYMNTLEPQSYGPLSYSNTVIGTLAVDGWAVTFGTATRGLGGAPARPGPSSLYQM